MSTFLATTTPIQILLADWARRHRWPRWFLKRILGFDPASLPPHISHEGLYKAWLLGLAEAEYILVPPAYRLRVLTCILDGSAPPKCPFVSSRARLPWRGHHPITEAEIAAWRKYWPRCKSVFKLAIAFGRTPEDIATADEYYRPHYCREASRLEPFDVVARRCMQLWGQNYPIKHIRCLNIGRAGIIALQLRSILWKQLWD